MSPRVVVFAPLPLLTVTIEERGGDDDIHLHAGGQGVWVARMLRCLEVDVVLVASFGGETGAVVQVLVEQEDVEVRAVPADAPNAAYVHDRRSGDRQKVAEMRSPTLARHELDELYGVVLAEGLDADACVLGGPSTPDTIPAETYRRLAADLGANGTPVIADLSGQPLQAVLAGGVRTLKVSHEQLIDDGLAKGDEPRDLLVAMRELREAGAQDVIVSRAGEPALALLGDRAVEIVIPRLHPVDERGAGDSMTAGIAAGLAAGRSIEEAVQLGAAAGGLNVTRRGLGTGEFSEIARLGSHVELRPLDVDERAERGDEDKPGRTESPDDLAKKAAQP